MLRFIQVLLLTFILGHKSFANSHDKLLKRDLLHYNLNKAQDREERYRLLDQLVESYKQQNIDSALVYAGLLLKQAEELNKLENIAEAHTQLGMLLGEKKLLDSSHIYLEKAWEFYTQLHDEDSKFKVAMLKAATYGAVHQNEKSIKAYLNLLDLKPLSEIGDSSLSVIYNNLGLAYQYTGSFDKALNYHLKSLKIKEKLKLRDALASSHDNLGLSYFELKEYDKAMHHYNQALEIYKNLGDTVNILRRNYAIGGAFYGKGEYEKAYGYLDDALKTAKIYKHLPTELNCYQVMGLIHLKKKEFEKAEEFLLLAQNRFPEDGPVQMLIYIKSNLAVLYLNWGTDLPENRTLHLNTAVELSKETEKLSIQSNFLKMEKKSVEVLYKAYRELGKHSKSLPYAERYIALNDSLLSAQKQDAIVEMEKKFEAEKKDLEIGLLKKDKELKELSLVQSEMTKKRQQWIIGGLIGLAVIISAFSVVVFRLYRDKKKANSQLLQRNELISRQKEENEVLLKEVHHRVKNNMQIISSLLDLQFRGKGDEPTAKAIKEGQNRVRAMSLIHEMLYESENMAEINIHDYIHKLFGQILELNEASANKIHSKINVADNINLNLDIAIPLGLILTELLTNSFKYAFKDRDGGEIQVNLNPKNEEELLLEVSDDGVGLPEGFDLGKTKSLGLRLVKMLTKQIQGSVSFKSFEGTRAQFSIPKQMKLS